MPVKSAIVKWVGIVVVVIITAYCIFAWREGVASADLEAFRQMAAKKEQEAAVQQALLTAQNDQLKASNAALETQNSKLETARQNLAARNRELAAAAEQQVETVVSLALAEVAVQIAERLEVAPEAVRALPDGVLLNESASRKNLQELIRGQTAGQRIQLAMQEVAALETQKSNLEQEVGQWKIVAENNEIRVATVTNLLTLKSEEMQKEVSMLKATARKRHFWYALGGAAIGAIVVSR